MKLQKSCPRCGKDQSYTLKENLQKAIKNKRICLDCVHELNKSTKNYIGQKFGTLTIINQYFLEVGVLKVDYKCDCGFINTNKSFSDVRRRKMCIFCKKKNEFKILPNGETSFNLLFTSYQKRAKKKSLLFDLTQDQFRYLTKQNCFYCNDIPSAITRPNSPGGGYVFNGIDRKDSSKGYISENIVTCCKTCNYAKRTISFNDFLNHIEKIYKNRCLKK